jgi:dTDP-4-amino-4,6-dideoxygalactose transaminase
VREQHFRRYDKGFAGVDGLIERPPEALTDRDRHAFHLYTILISPERLSIDRDGFIQRLRAAGIGCGVHYRVVHQHGYYRQRLGLRRGDFPAAEFIADRTISLPLSPAMSEQEVDDVIDAVTGLLDAHRR